MAGLEDFSFSLNTTLADFTTEDIFAPKAVSKSSNLNMATYAAALSGDPENAVNTYRQINAEYDTLGNSPTADATLSSVKQKALESSQRALADILISPDLDDAQKQSAVNFAMDKANEIYGVRNLASTAALAAPVENESENASISRMSMVDKLRQANDIKRQQQVMLSEELNKENPPFIEAAANLAEIILPFATAATGAKIRAAIDSGDSSAIANVILAGTNKKELRAIIENTPPEKALEVTRATMDLINSSSTIVFGDENEFNRRDYLVSVFDVGGYSDRQEWVDNAFSMLDVLGVGGLAAKAAKGTKLAERTSEIVSNTKKRFVKSQVQPTSLGNNYKDTNPDKAKATFSIAMAEDGEEGANALYGAGKLDVASDTMMPELLNADGTVMAKVGDIDRLMQLEEGKIDINDLVTNDGKIYTFQPEKASAMSQVVNGFRDAIGMTARREMFQIAETGDGLKIRGVYGPPNSGFTSAEDALNMAEWSLREYGITRDNIKLLVRDGANYRVSEAGELDALLTKDVIKGGARGIERQPKDFLVAVDYDYNVAARDITEFGEATVKNNLLDRLGIGLGSWGMGSAQRHILDVHSMLDPVITKGAVNAIDRGAGIEKELLSLARDKFAKGFSKSSRADQETMRKLIDDANERGEDFNYNKLIAEGLGDNEIETLKGWREFWDQAWVINNRDAARSLKNNGYYEFVDKGSDTKLFAKPVHRNNAGKVSKIFDVTTGKVRRLSDKEVKDLYETEGTLAQLHRPMVIGDEAIEHVLVTNKADGNYLRGINDASPVLNYRKGYYSVHYTDPYFVVKQIKNSRGEVISTKAVATASNRKDAEAMAKASGTDYFARQDLKGSFQSEVDHWDLHQSRGMSSQKVRGKRLEDADSFINDPRQSNILDPVDSMIVSARSLARRVSMRDMLEVTKQRFIKQYGEFLPVNQYGEKVMPTDIREVIYRGQQAEDAKKLGDARTTYEYINYLENGYINHIDDSYKTFLLNIADAAGTAGISGVDKLARWMAAAKGPSALGKNLAFNLYLASNPVRQFIVQSHQALQLLANFPQWSLSMSGVPQISVFIAKQMGVTPTDQLLKAAGWTAAEASEAFRQFSRTGQVAAIDKHNLVRGALSDLADQMNMGKTMVGRAWKVTTLPLTISRKLGFDAGENVSTMASWLAHRDAAIRAGRDMSRTDVQADVAALARNYTYNMNAAGDMPYNQNLMSVVFQFMQVPHKALLGMLTNRVLTPQQKARLIAFNATMYTLPPAAMYDWFGDILPEDPVWRDRIVQGLEGYMLNSLIGNITGKDSSIDFSSLAPTDMHGLYGFISELASGNVGTAIASTPAGQLLVGNNPRLTNFLKSGARYFNVIDDFEGTPTEFGQVVKEAALMFSGLSNGFKAAYALEWGKKFGAMESSDDTIPTPNAIAIALGFGSMEDAQEQWVRKEVYEKMEDFEADVKKVYQETKRQVLYKYPGISQTDYATRVSGEAWRVFGNDNFRAKQAIRKEIMADLVNKDAWLHLRLGRDWEIYDSEEHKAMINAAPYASEEKRKQALETIEIMRKLSSEGK